MELLRSINRFCKARGMSPTRFGQAVANDGRLVHDIRRGREIGARMVSRILAYMAQEDGR